MEKENFRFLIKVRHFWGFNANSIFKIRSIEFSINAGAASPALIRR